MAPKPSRTARLRAPFVVTVATVGASLAGCGGNVTRGDGDRNEERTPHPPATGEQPGSLPPGCPAEKPPSGEPCAVEGTACGYDRCFGAHFTYEATCQDGAWSVALTSCNPPPIEPPTQPAACPADEPSGGAPCSGSLSCDYGDCLGSPTLTADCIDGQCELGYWSCNPPSPSECPETPPNSGDWCYGDVECQWGEWCGEDIVIQAACESDEAWLVWEELPGPDDCSTPGPPPLDAGLDGGPGGHREDAGIDSGLDAGIDPVDGSARD